MKLKAKESSKEEHVIKEMIWQLNEIEVLANIKSDFVV